MTVQSTPISRPDLPLGRFVSPLAIEATQCGAGLYCLALGTLMLVAPHAFQAQIYQAFHTALPWWGMLFTLGAVGIGLAAIRSLSGPLRLLLHLPAMVGLLAIACVWLSFRVWPQAGVYGLLSAAILYAAVRRSPDDAAAPSADLLPLVFGLIGIVNGVAILLEPRGFTLGGLDPTLVRIMFAALYAGSGSVMLVAQARYGQLIRASAIAQITLAALLAITCALIFMAGPRAWITLVYTVAFAPILAAQPWLGPRLHHAIHSFRARVALLTMSAAALPLIATVALVSSQQDRSSLAEAIDYEVIAAEDTAHDLDGYLNARKSAIQALSGQPRLLARSADEQTAILQATSQAYPDLANVGLFDADGRQIARSDDRPLTQLDPGTERWEVFDRIAASSQPVIMVVRHSVTDAPAIAIGVPILGNGNEFLGAVIGGPHVDQLTTLIDRSISSSGRTIYLVDAAGRAVMHPDGRLVQEGADLSTLAPVQALMTSVTPGFSYGGMSDQRLVGVARLTSTGWGVVSERPASEALASDRLSREAVFIILWLAIIASAGAGAYMASRLVRPLRLLGQAATEFGSGIQKPLPTADTREISTLIAEIDRMRQRIIAREQDLQAAELHYRLLFENSPAPAWIMDRHSFRFLDVNEATVRALGYSRAEILTMEFTQLKHDEAVETVGDELTERHRLVTGHDTRDVHVIDVEISARPIVFQGREVLLSVMHDITEPTQAVALRDEFLSIAAHELKTPITVLRGQSQLNLRRLNRAAGMAVEQVGAAFVAIDEQSRKLQRLVDQLLDVSRIESGRLTLEIEETDIVGIVQTAVTSARLRGGNRTIEFSAPEEIVARVDPLRLEQVLANLLDNALKYSPATQPIEISLSIQDEPDGAASIVQIEVRDYGRGIPDEDHERIFQRFQQVHPNDQVKGFGLGLYVCRQIVELHGGVIRVDSSAGIGTRFVVTLPVEARVLAPATE